jgi:hypothetical protein
MREIGRSFYLQLDLGSRRFAGLASAEPERVLACLNVAFALVVDS